MIAAIIVASVTRGMAGLKDFAEPLPALAGRAALVCRGAAGAGGDWSGRCGLNMLLGAPLPTLAQLGPWYGIFLMFPMAMIDAPLQENSGWHGYAMPRFPANRSRLANTLIIGVLLAGWHFPLTLAEPSLCRTCSRRSRRRL